MMDVDIDLSPPQCDNCNGAKTLIRALSQKIVTTWCQCLGPFVAHFKSVISSTVGLPLKRLRGAPLPVFMIAFPPKMRTRWA